MAFRAPRQLPSRTSRVQSLQLRVPGPGPGRLPRVHALSCPCPTDPVVSVEWLSSNAEDVAVLDVRGRVDTVPVGPVEEKSTYLADYDAYLEGHKPGAVFVDWTKDGIDGTSSVPVQLQMDSDLFAASMEAKGVSSEKPVVVYDEGDGMMASRLWWMLKVHGHPCPLVLEGGWRSWQAAGKVSELHEPCTLKVYSYFEPQPQPHLRVTAEELLDELGGSGEGGTGKDIAAAASTSSSGLVLIDTRSAAQYQGLVRRGPRGGRIPGAVSLPRPELLDPETGWFKPLQEQQQVLEGLGLVLPGGAGSAGSRGGERKVVLYCNGGVAACTAALALERLGHRNWAVYDGSWNEWGNRGELPVES